jgi:hypothetical protein
MKYSLRSLMIVVTLVCVLLGSVMARVEYVRRSSAFHFEEARRHALIEHKTVRDALPDATAALEHAILGRRFQDAIWQPWTALDTTVPEVHPADAVMLAEDIVNNNASSFLDH